MKADEAVKATQEYIKEQRDHFAYDPEKHAPKNVIQEGKAPMCEIPLDLLKTFLAPALEYGSKYKYHRFSWRKGFPVSEVYSSTLRHLSQFWDEGRDLDEDAFDFTKGELLVHHLGMAMFGMICMMDTIKHRPEMDDRRQQGTQPIDQFLEDFLKRGEYQGPCCDGEFYKRK